MKRKYIAAIIGFLCICFIVFSFYIFNIFFPKAQPIQLPESKNINSISIICESEEKNISKENIDDLLLYLKTSTPTRKQSINDHPAVNPFYKIIIETTEENYYYFVYEEDNDTYIEMPYVGVYRANGEFEKIEEE